VGNRFLTPTDQSLRGHRPSGLFVFEDAASRKKYASTWTYIPGLQAVKKQKAQGEASQALI
jgi:hypothetical protein